MDDSTVSMDSGKSRATPEFPAMWGPFRLIEKVGQGGFGEVFKAWDQELQREMAVKLLIPRVGGSSDDLESILREARLHSRIHHYNVVAVHGAGFYDGRGGFWTDFVQGKTLSTLLIEQGQFGAAEAAHIGIEVCKALAAVHGAGLLHRDVKAANVMREAGGRILLMDFGLTQESRQPGLSGGTPPYIAPEMLAGEPATVNSDIYALGVLLFYLLTRRYPGEAKGTLIDYRPDVPEAMANVVSIAIDQEPSRRFASAGAMLSALSEVLGVMALPKDATAIRTGTGRGRVSRWLMFFALLLVAFVLVVMSPARKALQSGIADLSSYGGANDQYLTAEDLLRRYYKPNNVESSVALFEKIIAEDPKFALAYAGLGRAYWQRYLDTLDSSYVDKAKSQCKRALTLNRNLAPAHVTLGAIYANTGRGDLGTQELNEALALDPRSAEAHGALAELLRKQGRNGEVELNLQKASDLSPADWRWRNQLGLFYLSTGRLDAAEREFSEAIRLAPDNARAYNNLGVAHLRREEFAEAKTAFEKAVQLESHFSHFSNLGAVLQLQGDYAGAAAMYRKSIDLNPSNYLAWGNLGSVYRWSEGEKARAREAYSKAIAQAEDTRKTRPDDAILLARLGSYYAAVRNTDQSLPFLRRAEALAPADPTVLYFAGEAFELLGRRDRALALIEKALVLGYSREYVRRSPELAGLRADSRFTLVPDSKVR